MHIVVCVKQVSDPDAPFSMMKVDAEALRVVPASGVPAVVSPFDEQAIEAALRVREQSGDAKITVITVGAESARNALKHALAMGADAGVLVQDEAAAAAGGEAVAYMLAAAIRELQAVDLVLTGRQAADWDAGVVGGSLAEMLDWPAIMFACDVKLEGSTLTVERVISDATETCEAALPAVVTISNELGAARKPSLRETMRAARKPVSVRRVDQLPLEMETLTAIVGRRQRVAIFEPTRSGQCELITGGTEHDQAHALVQRLRELRALPPSA